MSRHRNKQGTAFGYDLTRSRILEHIVLHDLRDGDLLPSLRALAEDFCEGRIKLARMAVAMLVEEGIVEAHRGRGVFLRNRELALQRSGRSPGPLPVSSEDSYPSAVAFSLKISTPCVKLHLIEKTMGYRTIWEDIVEGFNAAQGILRVALSCGAPPSVEALASPESPDLVQLQSFRLGPYVRSGVIRDLAPLFEKRTLKRFYPSLWMDPPGDGQPLWGLPVTAVVACLTLNREGAKHLRQPIPQHWESFEAYVEFVERAVRQVVGPQRLQSVVHSTHGVLYHMTLAGVLNSLRMADLPDFSSPAIRGFLSLFGRVFCRPECYINAWSEGDPIEKADGRTLLVETHTYNAQPIDLRSGLRRSFVPLPLGPEGTVVLNPHYLLVRQSTPYLEECVKFLNHLLTDETMTAFLRKGHLVGWSGVEQHGDPALLDAVRRGAPSPEHDERYDRFVAEVANPRLREWQLGSLSVNALCDKIEEARRCWMESTDTAGGKG